MKRDPDLNLERKYLNFPITLIPDIYKETDTYHAMDKIIDYGMVAFIVGLGYGLDEITNDMSQDIGITCSERAMKSAINGYRFNFKKGAVMTSIDKDKAFEYRDRRISCTKNRREVMAICGVLAIRSIIGVKDYAKCYKGFLLSRMAGSAKSIPEYKLPSAVKKYSGNGGKRQWRNLITDIKKAGCSIYAPRGCRGFYASFRLGPLELAERVERKKREKAESEYNMSNDELRKAALENIAKDNESM